MDGNGTEKKQDATAQMVDFDYAHYAEVESRSMHTRGVTALTCGVISLITAVIETPFAPIFAIVGIVFGILAVRHPQEQRGLAVSGLICSVAGLILAVVMALVYLHLFAGLL